MGAPDMLVDITVTICEYIKHFLTCIISYVIPISCASAVSRFTPFTV